MSLGDYPPGAEYDPNAPYNQEEYPEKEFEVTVSITMSKTFTIKTDDYTITDYGRDEDGFYYEDRELNNPLQAVEDNIVLPNNLANYIESIFDKDLDLKAAGMCKYLKDAIEDNKDWCVDDLEAIQE